MSDIDPIVAKHYGRPRSGPGLAAGIALGVLVPLAFAGGFVFGGEQARRDARSDLRVARAQIVTDLGAMSPAAVALDAIERAYFKRTGEPPIRLLWD